MPTIEIEEFARALETQVRDAAIQGCDILLRPSSDDPVARRWREIGADADGVRVVVADVVDEAVFAVLRAIDEGALRMKYVAASGVEVDLTAEGQGEMAGWYMGSGGWRAMYSAERYVDDFADLADGPDPV